MVESVPLDIEALVTTPSTDRSQVAPPQRPQDAVAEKLQRAAAAIAARHGADLNQTPPAVEYDPVTKRRYFETAPIPLRRLLGSPLAMTGRWAQGPNKERKLSGGWGDPRSFSYERGSAATARHQGLDFLAAHGEELLACGDGRVTFAGYQSRTGPVGVEGARQGEGGQILNGKGEVVAIQDEVGFGGIAVHIAHDGDFEGYRTEYYHLSAVTVRAGQRLMEGQVIGAVGNSGVRGIGPHLHFQVALVTAGIRALVRPSAIVPNYWPGHADSTSLASATGQVAPEAPVIGVATAGTQLVTNAAQGVAQATDRAVIAQNQDVAEIRRSQARHADLVAGRLEVQQGALYAAVAAFQGGGVVVVAPVTFDFQTGAWSDGQPV